MVQWLRNCSEMLSAIFEKRWGRWLLGIYTVIGFYDTLVAQFLPAELGSAFPNLYSLLDKYSGFLDWYWWLIIGVFIFALICIEFAYRRAWQPLKAKRFKPTKPVEAPNHRHVDILVSPEMYGKVTMLAKQHGVSMREFSRQALIFVVDHMTEKTKE